MVKIRGVGTLGKFEMSETCKLFVRAKFTYSKILPMRTKVHTTLYSPHTLGATDSIHD